MSVASLTRWLAWQALKKHYRMMTNAHTARAWAMARSLRIGIPPPSVHFLPGIVRSSPQGFWRA